MDVNLTLTFPYGCQLNIFNMFQKDTVIYLAFVSDNLSFYLSLQHIVLFYNTYKY